MPRFISELETHEDADLRPPLGNSIPQADTQGFKYLNLDLGPSPCGRYQPAPFGLQASQSLVLNSVSRSQPMAESSQLTIRDPHRRSGTRLG